MLAPGTAWGEWSGEELEAALGYVPGDLERLGGAWTAAMPDYATPGVGNPLLGYLLAAVVGAALVVGVAWGVGGCSSRDRDGAPTTSAGRRLPALALASRARGRGALAGAQDGGRRRRAPSPDVLENEELASRPGLLQRLDPRVKLLTLLLFAVTASLVHSIWVLLGARRR